jgi:hypothetical protein
MLMVEHSTAATAGLRWPSNRREAKKITTSTAKHGEKL